MTSTSKRVERVIKKKKNVGQAVQKDEDRFFLPFSVVCVCWFVSGVSGLC